MSPSPAQQRKSPNTKLQASPWKLDSSAEWQESGWWAGGWGGWNAPVAWEGWSWNSATEGWAQEDWANESQQVRKMLQRPLTSVLEMQAVDDAAADIERELEQRIDAMNAAESTDDRFKSQDSQATLVLGQLTSSESLDDGAGDSQDAPEKLQRRSSTDSQLSKGSSCSASHQLQDYLDTIYENSHRRPSRSPRERDLPSEVVKEEVEPRPAEQLPMPTLATNPRMPPINELPMPTLAMSPSLPLPPAVTGQLQDPTEAAKPAEQLPMPTLDTNPKPTDQQAVTGQLQDPTEAAKPAEQLPMPTLDMNPKPTDQQAVTGQPLVKEEMAGAAHPSDLEECPPARDEDQSYWRKDKYGRDLKPAALYARFYRSGRSPMATVGFRVAGNL